MKRKRIIAIAVIGVCGVLLLVVFGLRKNHNQQFDTLRTSLQQNLILIDSIQAVSTATPASQMQHTTIANALKDNLQTLNHLPVDKLSKDHAKAIDRFIASEKYTLGLYEGSLDTMSKALLYSPADDLTVASQQTAQATAARDGIDALLKQDIGQELTIVPGQISLTTAAHTSLTKARDCFGALAHGSTTVRRCVDTYQTARQALNEDLQELWKTPEMAKQRTSLALVVKQLDR